MLSASFLGENMQDNGILLSICIPTYNRINYLLQCLTSFISQVNEDIIDAIEIIVSDNASTDGTVAALKTIVTEHSYVHYYQNSKNIGVELNIFNLVKKARGKYVWIFGDDDVILNGALRKLLPYLYEAKFDYFLTNKTVKDKDLKNTLIERQNLSDGNIPFSDIKDMCCKFGLFTQLGFLSTAIFKRLPFVKVDFTPYLHTIYPQTGVCLEAFNNKPCLYISDVLVCQRQFNQRQCGQTMHYVWSVYLLRMFKVLKSRKILEYSIIEKIKENMINQKECTLTELVLGHLESIVAQGGLITESEWLYIIEIFYHLDSEEYKRRIIKVLSDYISIITTQQIINKVGIEDGYKNNIFDLDLCDVYYRFGKGRNGCIDSINQRLIINEQANEIKKMVDRYRTVVDPVNKLYSYVWSLLKNIVHRLLGAKKYEVIKCWWYSS